MPAPPVATLLAPGEGRHLLWVGVVERVEHAHRLRGARIAVVAGNGSFVLPRVESHLRMIGESAPWKPLWISIYNAKCLTLNDYRHGRVLFAGDAAHLVPIFGVRGLNSGLDDAGNLAWKLALVVQGRASAGLLDSYSSERVHATCQNIAYGAKSTEFMAPRTRVSGSCARRRSGWRAKTRRCVR